MFFSKLAFAGLALLSVATSAFASPAGAEIVARGGDQLTTDLQNFQTTVEPIIDAFVGLEANVDALAVVFADITAKVQADVFVEANIDVYVDICVDVIVDLIVKLDLFLTLDLALAAKIDVFLSAFLTAFENKHAGYGKLCGAKIPVVDLNVFVVLKLTLTAKILGLISIL